ncbi:hypothetical protein NDU88_001528 [Pleurodeles waltl]|uniref:Uncharacterized protein n=1 Tax=Pleurodeles waltl TaxID=8319 RepID=A0AAV7RDA9_PLEWA|nr:hypothetical protein NDU88_001528 [Pleurodeles waltl]
MKHGLSGRAPSHSRARRGTRTSSRRQQSVNEGHPGRCWQAAAHAVPREQTCQWPGRVTLGGEEAGPAFLAASGGDGDAPCTKNKPVTRGTGKEMGTGRGKAESSW